MIDRALWLMMALALWTLLALPVALLLARRLKRCSQ